MSRRVVTKKVSQPTKPVHSLHDDLSVFFSYCPHPFAVQSFIASVAAGNTLSSEDIPVFLLPHALLLHAVAPEPGVVDNAVRLTERILEEYDSDHTGHGPRFWHPQAHLVSGLVYGRTQPEDLAQLTESFYITRVYAGLTNGFWKRVFAPIAGRK